MAGKTPPRPSGSSREAHFMQWVWDAIANRLKFIDTPTVKWDSTSRGFAAHTKGGKGGLGPTVEVTLCDQDTGDEKTYQLYGVELTEEEEE